MLNKLIFCVVLLIPATLWGQVGKELASAIQSGDTSAIKRLVEDDNKLLTRSLPNIRQPPLHHAVRTGKLDVVKTLVSLGANIEQENSSRQSAMIVALSMQNKEITKFLLENLKNPNSTDRNKTTMLMFATMYRQNGIEVIEALLNAGADPNLKNSSQQSALHVACYYRRNECAERFIAKGADLESRDNNQNTPLLACVASQGNFLDLLIEKGADTSAINRQGQNALHLAAQSSNVQAAKLLIDRVSDVDKMDRYGRTPLMMAVYANNNEIIKVLVKKGADPNGGSSTQAQHQLAPILYATQAANIPMIDTLLAAGAKIDKTSMQGETVLHIAANAGGMMFTGEKHEKQHSERYLKVLKHLIELEADPNAIDKINQTPFQLAANNRFYDAVEYLADKTKQIALPSGVKSGMHWSAENGLIRTLRKLCTVDKRINYDVLNDDQQTPLHVAATHGSIDVAKFLISRGAGIEKKDQFGFTPLLIAASEGEHEVIQALVSAGADLKQTDATGQSALDMAAWNGSKESVKLLIDSLSKDDLVQLTGYTPLHSAAWQGNTEAAKILIEAGCPVNAMDSDGWTALHKAAYRLNAEVVALLLAGGADKSIKNEIGMTALDMAMGNKESKVADLLK